MHHVPLPDPLYVQAAQFAAASGLSVEAYITEAVQLRVAEDTPTILSPDQVAIIRQSQADMRNGQGLTIAQVKEQFAANKAAWLQNDQP